MRNYDAWLEAPYQDSLRNGEAMEALEEMYLESEEFAGAFDTWQMDSLPEYGYVKESAFDLYLATDEYKRGLNAYIEAWEANQPDVYDDYDEEQ